MNSCNTYGEKEKDSIAKAKCPGCGKIVHTNCEGCVTGDILVHLHPDKEGYDGVPDCYDVKWLVYRETGQLKRLKESE